MRVEGSMPLDPAVGAATILPIEAFTSTTAIEDATMRAMRSPISARDLYLYSLSASSPVSPDTDD